jgi:CDP-glucose 4,6-dehydratase
MGTRGRTLEIMGINQFSGLYRNKRVLITGHTGFKGSWLALWLHKLGADITGVALPPLGEINHWELLDLPIDDRRADIRDIFALESIFQDKQPEIVFHLAAQPLVRRSYNDPVETWSTNVMGTVNLLEVCRKHPSVKAIVIVTTDKCYENREWPWGYRENDSLGGHDPYSASKAGAEIAAASYRSAFFHQKSAPLVATARAGNVIGGGDWSVDRLIPDLIRALKNKQALEVRSPKATRPWQHVLESLSGYLLLGQKLFEGNQLASQAWNFGPNSKDNCTVDEVLIKLSQLCDGVAWRIGGIPALHETNYLHLDSAKAQSQLNWRPVWGVDEALKKTMDWYLAWIQNDQVITENQLTEYVDLAFKIKSVWAISD